MTTDWNRPGASHGRTLLAVAVVGILAWTALEFGLRRGLGPYLADAVGSPAGAEAIIMVAAIPLVAALIAWIGLRAGIERPDWEYDFSLRPVGAGLGGIVAYYAVYLGIALALIVVLQVDPSTLGQTAAGSGTAVPTWAIALFLVGNGVMVPITEELAWRGVIQTALTESYGQYVAILVTALAFVGKHLVVDLAANPFRVASLLVLAFVFCGLRARWGTGSSTVAHLGLNLLATAGLVFA